MNTTKKHFEIFKQECQKWIDKLKLDNWEVHYGWEEENNNRASCYPKLSGYIVTLNLSTDWGKNCGKPVTENEIRDVAKHEVIHLLLARLSTNGRTRYVSEDDMEESEEELVRKLEKIIK